jgi:hypothetical protein
MPSPVIALDLITSSMRLAGIIATGETPTADEASDALDVLNDMLDAWAVENLMLFRSVNSAFNLIAAQQNYTIGAGGNFNTTRPVGIDGAYVTYAGLDFPLRLLTTEQWDAIALKSMQAPLPVALYYDPAMPLGTVSIWPIPSQNLPITLSVGMQFTQPASLATTLIYPPGYAKAVRYNLAVELAAEFGMPADAVIVTIARDLLGKLKVRNRQQPVALLDPLLANSGSYGLADFLSGND